MSTTSFDQLDLTEPPWLVIVDARGGARWAPLDALSSAAASGSLTWLHLPAGEAGTSVLSGIAGLPPKVADYFARPADQTRLVNLGEGLLTRLRGVEQPPGADEVALPEMQVWIEQNRVVTAASQLPAAIRELHADLMAGAGPCGPADLLGRLALLLIRDLGSVLDQQSGELDLMETRILTRKPDHHLGRRLNRIRLDLLRLHRHLSPQRTLLHELLQEHGRHRLGAEDALASLREASERVDDRLARLEGLREHCGTLQGALSDLQAQRMNDALYLLSLYTALFLPMGVLTGLLGINVAGIPGEKSPLGFWIVCLLLVLLGVVGYVIFQKMGLLKPMGLSLGRHHRHKRQRADSGGEGGIPRA